MKVIHSAATGRTVEVWS
ncbi:unnamed protein product [Acanthoscelides obtectus]|uniref:Uncharacterized protein n=1 Tax=Acanthoscelides obtectus TaxID=200917 RepID=A0A9P0QK12_ACAOB|nr:unnamed protein product [Acanthoscelides obtectus]CAK1686305.1 hypothetical protein AOBTE_LOCUS35910 [Acanthoscelides obtectus]